MNPSIYLPAGIISCILLSGMLEDDLEVTNMWISGKAKECFAPVKLLEPSAGFVAEENDGENIILTYRTSEGTKDVLCVFKNGVLTSIK